MSETPNIRVEQEMQSTSPNQAAPGVRVIRYQASNRILVQGFADVEVDGWLRLNGINLMRDGSLKPGQLTPLIGHRRCYIDSIQVIDGSVRKQWETTILAAVREHLETLPPDQRVKPPQPPEPRQADKQVATASAKPSRENRTTKPQNAPVQAKPASAATSATPVKPKPIHTKPPAVEPKLPPPVRLFANFPRTTL
jgi:hypothetical protein